MLSILCLIVWCAVGHKSEGRIHALHTDHQTATRPAKAELFRRVTAPAALTMPVLFKSTSASDSDSLTNPDRSETMARFIFGADLEDEPHTALEDAQFYEAPILHYLLADLTRKQILEAGR